MSFDISFQPLFYQVTQEMVNALLVECRTRTASHPNNSGEQGGTEMETEQGEKAAEETKEPAKTHSEEEVKKHERERKEREARKEKERKERERRAWEKEERAKKERERSERARREREKREEERREWERRERERRERKRAYKQSSWRDEQYNNSAAETKTVRRHKKMLKLLSFVLFTLHQFNYVCPIMQLGGGGGGGGV